MSDRSRSKNPSNLAEDEQEEVEERLRLKAPVVYEVVRQEGEEELRRPFSSLWWSGVAAGLGIAASIIAKGALHGVLPDAPWRDAVSSIGYCFGFVIVILGRLQLFTENTITAVLPLLAERTRRNLLSTARLWAIVLLANFVGTLIVAALVYHGGIVPDPLKGAIVDVSRHIAHKDALGHLMLAIPAGFLMAAIVWILPSAEGSEFWVIVFITYLIGVSGFSHVVAGSMEAFVLVIAGELAAWDALGTFLIPALLGNIIGGTGLFAMLAYAQVQKEI